MDKHSQLNDLTFIIRKEYREALLTYSAIK